MPYLWLFEIIPVKMRVVILLKIMKKSKTQTFNISFLKKKTPILGFTVLQLVILFVVINSGAITIVLSQRQQTDAPTASTNVPTFESSNIEAETVAEEAQQNTPQNNTSTQNTTPKTNNTNTASSLPDQYGCVPSSSGYESCVMYAKKNALSAWCSEQSKKAGDTYYPASLKAKAAYDVVMAEWDSVKDLPYYQRHPYEQYAADAKTKYNAIIKPAYTTYVSTINSLNTQGCNVILTYSDTSWAGY
jgi:hypothetical protein